MYYVVDNYALITSDGYATRKEAEQDKKSEEDATGLFIYSIVEAQDNRELSHILEERQHDAS